MTISQPQPQFTDSDRRLLKLMSSLLEEQKSREGSASNLPAGEIGLSLSEAAELVSRLAEFVESQRFALAEAFVENVTSTEYKNEQRVKEIFLSERRRRGRTRAMSGALWADFQARLGIGNYRSVGTKPMTAGYLERMERHLLSTAGVSKDVAEAVLGLLRSQRGEIDRIRLRQRTLRQGLIRETLTAPLRGLRQVGDKLADRKISGFRVVSAMTIVADVSVLFTTRDWTTTGTLSTMAGAAAGSMADD